MQVIKFMKKIIATFFLALISFSAHAAISDQERQGVINTQNNLVQRDQQNERGQTKEKDLQQVEKDKKEIEVEEELELYLRIGKVVQDLNPTQCFKINKIVFSANKILPKNQEKIFTAEYLGKCVTIRQIVKLNKKISDYFAEEGYTNSRSEVEAQGINRGILNIKIIEVHLEDIVFNDEKFSDKTQKFMAFGEVRKGKILNLKKMEQGLEQINRLQSNSARVKIVPGKDAASSVIAIENTPKNRLRLNASYDNTGNKLTGEKRETVGLVQDNLFWLNDNLTVSRTANDLDSDRKNGGGSNLFVSTFSIPFQSYNLTLRYSKSSYFFWSDGVTRFKSSGQNESKSASLDKILIRDKKFKLSSNFTFTNRENKNFISDVKVDASSRKASIASLSLPVTFFLDKDSLFLKPTYNKGLNVLNARKDDPNLSKKSAHAEFDVFKFYGNYSKKSKVYEVPVSYNVSFDSQIAKQRLYGIDQFSVGGIYSVRGFKDGSIFGDSGYNLRNEVSVNLGKLFDLEKSPQFLSNLNRFSIAPFYDYGYIKSKAGQVEGRLSGAGFKLGFKHEYLNASLTVSRAISKSRLLGRHYQEDSAIFFNVGSEVGFF